MIHVLWKNPFERLPKTSEHVSYSFKRDCVESEPFRIRKHFYHPASKRRYSLMTGGVLEETSKEVLHYLENTESISEFYQRVSHGPHRFRASRPEKDGVFNHIACTKVMILQRKSVLHVVDKDTKLSAAAFLRSWTTEDTWETFMRIWGSVHFGFLDTIATD